MDKLSLFIDRKDYHTIKDNNDSNYYGNSFEYYIDGIKYQSKLLGAVGDGNYMLELEIPINNYRTDFVFTLSLNDFHTLTNNMKKGRKYVGKGVTITKEIFSRLSYDILDIGCEHTTIISTSAGNLLIKREDFEDGEYDYELSLDTNVNGLDVSMSAHMDYMDFTMWLYAIMRDIIRSK